MQADPLPVELGWDAPAECPTQAEVLRELQRITRVKPGRAVTPIRARAQIAHDGTKYRLQLRTEREDQTGETDLESSDCGVLRRGVTLVLALALGDGIDVIAEDEAEATPPEAPPPTKAPPVPSPPPAKVAHEPPEKQAKNANFHVVPALSAVFAHGFLGSAAFAAQPSLALSLTHFVAFTEVGLWPMQTAARVQGVSARLEALSGTLGVCAREPFGAFAISGCARGTIGVVHGRSVGAFHDGESTAPDTALGPALVLMTPLAGAVRLRFEAALDFSLAPPSFDERDFGTIYRVSRVVPQLSLGLAFDPSP